MVRLGAYILDVNQGRLLREDGAEEVAIEPKLFELLVLFVERANTNVSRKDILDNLWAGSLVTDNAINKLVANLRKVLHDDAKDPRYIKTISKRGYRLVCEVIPLSPALLNEVGLEKSDCKFDSSVHELSELKSKGEWVKYFFIFVFSLFAFYSLYFFNENVKSGEGFSIALTRAQGVEKSPFVFRDKVHLYYLKENEDGKSDLWVSNIKTGVTKRSELHDNISGIIAVVEENENDYVGVIYLSKNKGSCSVYKDLISSPTSENQILKESKLLFDCSDRRIKDLDYHSKNRTIYYTAQPRNFWPNQIYIFDLEKAKHSLIAQPEPSGWGHHSIDISPDGNKLLIMSTDSDHKTKLLSMNLSNGEVVEGAKFSRPVYEAIWHHDSERIYHYSSPPNNQIVQSDFDGRNSKAIVSISEQFSSKMSRFPDGKNVLFSTNYKDFDNLWINAPENYTRVSNSTVLDLFPAFFHHKDQYLFLSNRSGRLQIYWGEYQSDQPQIVSNFVLSYSFGNLSISSDDKNILLSVDNKIYLVPTDDLSNVKHITSFKKENLVYKSNNPIIAIDWIGNEFIAVTLAKKGEPELVVLDLSGKRVTLPKGLWGYGLTDGEKTESYYLVDAESNFLYRATPIALNGETIVTDELINTNIILPTEFYHVKVDNGFLYYFTTEKDEEYLHIVPIDNSDEEKRFRFNEMSSYDVSKGKIMVSDKARSEGDIHQTMY
nr:winged helix-turn-helix domain-containing protein [Bowmanella yangjiangensis]